MKLCFVRHAESAGNASGQYNESFSGDLTEKGRQQALELVARLLPCRFDAVAVSPLERTVNTVLPYLERSGLRAEAWPELVEMRGRKDVDAEPPAEVRYGAPVEIPAAARGLVGLRPDPEGRLMPPPGESYQEGQRRARLAAARLLALYGGGEASVLLVGHACNGARVLEALMRIELDGRFQHHNVGITLMEQKANGDFIMRCMSRVPDALGAAL